MRRFRIWECRFLIGILTVLVCAAAYARTLNASNIVKRAADEYDRVRDYTVDAKVAVSAPDVHVPEMNVKIYYKKPDSLHIESKDSFAVLPRDGLVIGNPLREMLRNSRLSLTGSEKALGRDCYLVEVAYAHMKDGRSTKARVWIDKERWVVVQMFIDPDSGPSLRLSLWYAKVGGKFWMPARSQAVIQFPAIPGDRAGKAGKTDKPSSISVQFSNYKINSGLSDKIFQKKRSN